VVSQHSARSLAQLRRGIADDCLATVVDVNMLFDATPRALTTPLQPHPTALLIRSALPLQDIDRAQCLRWLANPSHYGRNVRVLGDPRAALPSSGRPLFLRSEERGADGCAPGLLTEITS